MRMTTSILTASALALAAASAVQAQSLSSAGALAFDDADTLFVVLVTRLQINPDINLAVLRPLKGAQSSTISMLRLQHSWLLSQSRS